MECVEVASGDHTATTSRRNQRSIAVAARAAPTVAASSCEVAGQPPVGAAQAATANHAIRRQFHGVCFGRELRPSGHNKPAQSAKCRGRGSRRSYSRSTQSRRGWTAPCRSGASRDRESRRPASVTWSVLRTRAATTRPQQASASRDREPRCPASAKRRFSARTLRLEITMLPGINLDAGTASTATPQPNRSSIESTIARRRSRMSQ